MYITSENDVRNTLAPAIDTGDLLSGLICLLRRGQAQCTPALFLVQSSEGRLAGCVS